MRMTDDWSRSSTRRFPCAIRFDDEYNDVAIDIMLRYCAAANKMGMMTIADHVLLTLYLPSEEDRTALIMFTPFLAKQD